MHQHKAQCVWCRLQQPVMFHLTILFKTDLWWLIFPLWCAFLTPFFFQFAFFSPLPTDKNCSTPVSACVSDETLCQNGGTCYQTTTGEPGCACASGIAPPPLPLPQPPPSHSLILETQSILYHRIEFNMYLQITFWVCFIVKLFVHVIIATFIKLFPAFVFFFFIYIVVFIVFCFLVFFVLVNVFFLCVYK